MGERVCPGLPADWLNAWLAAIGALVLVPELRLHWSDDPVPLAVFSVPGEHDPAALVAAAWPTAEDIAALPIARYLEGHRELALNPSVDDWTDRVEIARSARFGWTLTSLYTDLAWSRSDRTHTIDRGQFNRAVPKGLTAFERLVAVVGRANPGDLARTLDGTARRVKGNGLGFDVTRIGSLADDTEKTVDPCLEVLAFYGLALFPTRGDGVRRRQRGWTSVARSGGFRWFTWSPALSSAGVDALLDAAGGARPTPALGLTGAWEVVSFEPLGVKDLTAGYGSLRADSQ